MRDGTRRTINQAGIDHYNKWIDSGDLANKFIEYFLNKIYTFQKIDPLCQICYLRMK